MTRQTRRDTEEAAPGPNWTIIALIGALAALIVMVAVFATREGSNPDKLTNPTAATIDPSASERACASRPIYDLIKNELFRRAARLRGSDQEAYEQLAGSAVARMENPVMESEETATHTLHCSGSLSIDLPPGIATATGRHSVAANVDYSVRLSGAGTNELFTLGSAEALVAPLATLSRVRVSAAEPTTPVETTPPAPADPLAPLATPSTPDNPEPPAMPQAVTRPSFDCANARTNGEIAVCQDPGLARLDRQMSELFKRALSNASPEQQSLLQRTRKRFLVYRDRCTNDACIAEAYVGRMREISDIEQGRWAPR